VHPLLLEQAEYHHLERAGKEVPLSGVSHWKNPVYSRPRVK
jgi:hypothetical protein